MERFVLAVMAVVLTACTITLPNYRSIANKTVPTNVELIGNFTGGFRGPPKVDAAYCSGVAVSRTRIITAGHCTNAAKTLPEHKGQILFDGKIKVRLENGKIVLARIIAEAWRADDTDKDTARDVALLEIDEELLTPAPLGNSNDLAVGDQVAIVGNTFGELKFSFTIGVVSYINRELDVGIFIQTDALSGPGNSGGGVFDMDGQLVGILTRGGDGISLFLPINDVITHIHHALVKGK